MILTPDRYFITGNVFIFIEILNIFGKWDNPVEMFTLQILKYSNIIGKKYVKMNIVIDVLPLTIINQMRNAKIMNIRISFIERKYILQCHTVQIFNISMM